MPSPKMKKLSILVTRAQLEPFLQKLISLGCMEINEADDFPVHSELHGLTKREVLDLVDFGATQAQISVIGTQYTVFLTGFISSRLEADFTALVDEFMCAWQIEDLSLEDLDLAPVDLNHPWFFKKYRLSGRKLFDPIRLKEPIESSENTATIDEDEDKDEGEQT
ncbi:MAG: hypothetical protein FWC75_09320 [Oscillospiraceae bacterium]|nr:hypothetical protein [Oscillospiraceae bacterium]